jgi:Outer membrane lipoprotein-sorting protein
MKKLSILLAAILLTAPLTAQSAKSPSLTDVMEKLRSWRQSTDFKANARLVKVSASGERTNYRISIRARYFPDGLKVLCDVIDPPAAKVRLLLQARANIETNIWSGHTGDADPKQLPAASMADSFLASDFAMEDLLDGQLLWKKQSWGGEEACGARKCYVIRSEPSVADHSAYSSVTTWVDQTTYFPIKVEKVAKSSGAVKDFTNYGLRQVKGRWSASQIEVEVKGKPGSSLLVITGGAENANLPASQFNPALLTHTE